MLEFPEIDIFVSCPHLSHTHISYEIGIQNARTTRCVCISTTTDSQRSSERGDSSRRHVQATSLTWWIQWKIRSCTTAPTISSL